MAVPTSTTYAAASGAKLYGGKFPPAGLDAILDQLEAAPYNTWVKVNVNAYSDAWPPVDFRPPFGAGIDDPGATIRCWSSFAWDDTNSRLVLWGGGHANASGNEVHTWSAKTRTWQLAFYPSDVKPNASGYETVDGPLHSPMSSHTYNNQQWLHYLNRFVTFGGAAQSSGAALVITDGSGATLRPAGCYTLDLSQAYQGYVGGVAGSNVQRAASTSAGVSLTGANAWAVRDWCLDHPQGSVISSDLSIRTNGAAAYNRENGHDVVYIRGNHLVRIEMVDGDYHHDIISRVGQAWVLAPGPQGSALDPVKNVFIELRDSTVPIEGWDLNLAGAANHNFGVDAAGVTGPDAAEFIAQMADSTTFSVAWDERRGCFLLWQRGGRVYSMTTPAAPYTSGWHVTKLCDDTADPRPVTVSEMAAWGAESDTGTTGKWRRARDLDVFVGLQGTSAGNVWMFKPFNWADPRF